MRDFCALFTAALGGIFFAPFLGMAVAGLRSGRVATEAQSPPIACRERPAAFAGLILFYLAAAAGFASVAVRAVAGLFATP